MVEEVSKSSASITAGRTVGSPGHGAWPQPADEAWANEVNTLLASPVVDIEEDETKSIEALVGYGSYERMRSKVRFEENNLFGTGRKFSVEARASTRGVRGAIAVTEGGGESTALAINEVALLRQVNQAAHIRILVNDTVKVEDLVCDGVLVATAAGSSAYNLSVQGPILPLGTDALAMTPISPFRPRRWRGAVLPSTARIRFEILDYYKRPVAATADAQEIRNVISVDVYEEKDIALKLMFDPDHSLEQRILDEQFL